MMALLALLFAMTAPMAEEPTGGLCGQGFHIALFEGETLHRTGKGKWTDFEARLRAGTMHAVLSPQKRLPSAATRIEEGDGFSLWRASTPDSVVYLFWGLKNKRQLTVTSPAFDRSEADLALLHRFGFGDRYRQECMVTVSGS